MNSGVACVGPLDQVTRAVGRAVVEDEDLGVLVRLAQGAVDRLADAVGAVERRDDHAYQRFRHGVAHGVPSSQSHEGKILESLEDARVPTR